MVRGGGDCDFFDDPGLPRVAFTSQQHAPPPSKRNRQYIAPTQYHIAACGFVFVWFQTPRRVQYETGLRSGLCPRPFCPCLSIVSCCRLQDSPILPPVHLRWRPHTDCSPFPFRVLIANSMLLCSTPRRSSPRKRPPPSPNLAVLHTAMFCCSR